MADGKLRALLGARSAGAVDADSEGRILVRSDESGCYQLSELACEERRTISAFDEPVQGCYVPGRRAVVVSLDAGGSERHQLYLADADHPPGAARDKLVPLALDPGAFHGVGGVSADGARVAIASNRRNGVDTDIWVAQLAPGELRCAELRCVDEPGGLAAAGGFSPDGRWLATSLPGPSARDERLVLIDMASGAHREVLPHEQPGMVGMPAWVGRDRLIVGSDVGRDVRAITEVDLATGNERVVVEDDWDLDCWTSADGRVALVAANVDGSSRARLYDTATYAVLEEITLPEEGVMAHSHLVPAPRLAPDGSWVAFSLSSPRRAGDVFVHRRGFPLEQRTDTMADIDTTSLVPPERAVVRSFDGENVPILLYRPRSGRSARVVVLVHGGPESQSQLAFNPVVQALALAGWAVVVPNVRGSTGYGRRYASLDDVTLRLDSVADLAAVHDWLPSAGLDPTRAVLWGGSYGGYMVLAALAFQPERWAAGVDLVGISDLVTFLENTSPYRRAQREREYGSLAADREFLAAASPLRRVDAMRAPLFVVHGANDPRVPLSEAQQLHAALAARGVPCELRVYADEGHGLAKLSNRLDAYPRILSWLDKTVPA